MIIKGKARGSHVQLIQYMMGAGENESVRLLHIEGTHDTENPYKAMREFALSQELTGSKKAFYHGQLSPAYEESMELTDEQYIDMVKTVAEKLGHEKPRMIVTEHIKNGHKHIHFALDRYDYDKGKLISDSYNYYKHDDARAEIEKKYDLVRTPTRRLNKDEQRAEVEEAWNATQSGDEFIDALKKKNLYVASTVKEKRPFRLVDDAGRNLDLVRELPKGVNTSDVRDRLKDLKLPRDSDVMEQLRNGKRHESKRVEARQEAEQVTRSAREQYQYEQELERARRKEMSKGRSI